jgi:3-oxoacyl-[acyl-carrier protein] reductase
MIALTGKVAIVTGGSRGIGRAIAERMGQEGATVVVNYTKSADRAQEVVQHIEASGGHAAAIQADMSILADVQQLFTETQEKFGRLDILVNNAGTATFTPIADVTEAEFDGLFALNVKGAFFAMQEAARRLADGGRIVNISSSITISGGPGTSVYAGTKGALEQFTMAAAKELGPRGITVNTVSPGGTETDLMYAVVPKAAQEHMVQASPLGRLGKPDDIADVVAFLCGDGGRWLTGQNIRANGGA